MDEDRQSGDLGRSDTLKATGRGASDVASEPLPESLRRRLDGCADCWVSNRGAQGDRGGRAATLSRSHLPWLVAAAGLALAVLGWWPQFVAPEGGMTPNREFSQWRARHARERMLASAGVLHRAWGDALEQGSGDLVWDPGLQRGFLRLRGLVANDPARAQYQLWIHDAARDDRYPVDGGVFDVPPGREEIIVAVQPRLPVSRAVGFAVTVERPGGVVVSAREKVVAVAQLDR